ncbi:MAG: Ig-like domain-containing protein [Anaerolineae bacterium]|nr:Ig-like domain-containing protein [Anaerolineae bacterium]
MRTLLFVWLLLPTVLALALAAPALAQEDEPPVELRLRRDFGYGSGLQMQGRFSMRVAAPGTVERVAFLVDGEVVGEDVEAPFIYRFNTGQFEDGWHTMEAIGYTATGEALASNSIRREFVPQSTANTFLFAVLGLVAAFVVLRYVLTRNSESANYGMLGGTVCPHCGRPFAYHVWSVNLFAGRLDRCRHCGKWSFTRRQSPQTLAEVEREFDGEPAVEEPGISEQERLRRQLESSRYEDQP